MPKTPGPKKPRVYEVAKDLGMSSEAVLQIVRRLGAEADTPHRIKYRKLTR